MIKDIITLVGLGLAGVRIHNQMKAKCSGPGYEYEYYVAVS